MGTSQSAVAEPEAARADLHRSTAARFALAVDYRPARALVPWSDASAVDTQRSA